MDLLTVVMHELGHVLGFEDLDPKAHDLMSGALDIGVRHIVGDSSNQTTEDSASLVVMNSEDTETSVPTIMEQAQRIWLTHFLVNASQDTYHPNDEIRIKIFDDHEKGMDNPILRRMYSKRSWPLKTWNN
jgi:hypothetical protein